MVERAAVIDIQRQATEDPCATCIMDPLTEGICGASIRYRPCEVGPLPKIPRSDKLALIVKRIEGIRKISKRARTALTDTVITQIVEEWRKQGPLPND